MANVIKIKKSGVANTAPISLEHGELAINYADGRLYYKNSSNTIVVANSASVSVSSTAPASPLEGHFWFDTTTAKLFAYYDSSWIQVGGSASITISDTAPVTPLQGNFWFDSSTGKLYSYYDSFWIQIGGSQGPIGPSGVHIGNSAPSSTNVLWADTSDPGEAIIPSGGSAGQTLTKSSSNNYDTQWSNTVIVFSHGSNANVARPDGSVVYWKGSVAPTNGLNGDLWYDTTGD